MLRAWIVKCAGLDSVVIANSRNRARRIVQKSALYTGFDADDWTKIVAHRAPQFDGLSIHETGPITPSIAEKVMSRTGYTDRHGKPIDVGDTVTDRDGRTYTVQYGPVKSHHDGSTVTAAHIDGAQLTAKLAKQYTVTSR